jgi:hypothetical protein
LSAPPVNGADATDNMTAMSSMDLQRALDTLITSEAPPPLGDVGLELGGGDDESNTGAAGLGNELSLEGPDAWSQPPGERGAPEPAFTVGLSGEGMLGDPQPQFGAEVDVSNEFAGEDPKAADEAGAALDEAIAAAAAAAAPPGARHDIGPVWTPGKAAHNNAWAQSAGLSTDVVPRESLSRPPPPAAGPSGGAWSPAAGAVDYVGGPTVPSWAAPAPVAAEGARPSWAAADALKAPSWAAPPTGTPSWAAAPAGALGAAPDAPSLGLNAIEAAQGASGEPWSPLASVPPSDTSGGFGPLSSGMLRAPGPESTGAKALRPSDISGMFDPPAPPAAKPAPKPKGALNLGPDADADADEDDGFEKEPTGIDFAPAPDTAMELPGQDGERDLASPEPLPDSARPAPASASAGGERAFSELDGVLDGLLDGPSLAGGAQLTWDGSVENSGVAQAPPMPIPMPMSMSSEPMPAALARVDLKKMVLGPAGVIPGAAGSGDRPTRISAAKNLPRLARARPIAVLLTVVACVAAVVLVQVGGDLSKLGSTSALGFVEGARPPISSGSLAEVHARHTHVTYYPTASGQVLVVAGEAWNDGTRELPGVEAVVYLFDGDAIVSERRAPVGVVIEEDALRGVQTAADVDTALRASAPTPFVEIPPGTARDFLVVFAGLGEQAPSHRIEVEFVALNGGGAGDPAKAAAR